MYRVILLCLTGLSVAGCALNSSAISSGSAFAPLTSPSVRRVASSPAGRATRADDRSEGLTCGEIEPDEIAAARRAIPALSHRRPDLYAGVMANPASGL